MNSKVRDIPCGITVPVKQFILLDDCPVAWRHLDLYVIRDETSSFYVGQSHQAFSRVWEHIKNGFKGRSEVGLFILCNWPKSLNFKIELLSSKSPEFDEVENNLLRAEEMLIKRYRPCFNISQNCDPCPIPQVYLPPSADIRSPRSLLKMRYQAEQSILKDNREKWLEME